MQTLSDLLRPWLDTFVEREGKQQNLAIQFIEHFPKKGWKLNYVEPRLSRMLSANADAVRFFFEDRARACTFLDLLQVPPEARDGILELADKVMRTGGDPNARLVIGAALLSRGREGAESLFNALETHFLNQRVLRPVLLLITEEQYKVLPRSFDDLPDFKVERRPDPQTAWERVQEAAGDEALIATRRTLTAVERWLAIDWKGAALVMEPSDALERYASDGTLPGLPPIKHPLNLSNGGPKLPAVNVPATAGETRQLMFALGDEAKSVALKLEPLQRLALARALGVQATSTPRERIEVDLDALSGQLGGNIPTVEKGALEEVLQRASRRPVDGQLMRVGDEIHVVNPSDVQSVIKHPRLKLHQVVYQEPVMERLLVELDNWTADDWREDPQLMRVVEKLDPQGLERRAFLHARASILWTEGDATAGNLGAPLEDWRAGLQRLLATEPPAAILRLIAATTAEKVAEYGPAHHPFLTFAGEAQRLQAWTQEPLMGLHPWLARMLWQTPPGTRELLLRRDQAAELVSFGAANHQGGVLQSDPGLIIPIGPDFLDDSAAWLDCFEASPMPGTAKPDDDLRYRCLKPVRARGYEQYRANNVWRYARDSYEYCNDRIGFQAIEVGHILPAAPFVKPWVESELEVPDHVWHEADRDLAFIWLALKRAAREDAVRLHDGRVLLPLGAGIFAEIVIRRCMSIAPENDPLQAGMVGTIDFEGEEQGWLLQPLHSMVITHRASTVGYGAAHTELGHSLPRTIFLAGHGLRADISFVSSPFFQSHFSGPSLQAVASAGAQVLDQSSRDDDAAAADDD